jgi:hypothetical protein
MPEESKSGPVSTRTRSKGGPSTAPSDTLEADSNLEKAPEGMPNMHIGSAREDGGIETQERLSEVHPPSRANSIATSVKSGSVSSTGSRCGMFGAKRVWVSSARPENGKERNLKTFLTGFLETAEGIDIHVTDDRLGSEPELTTQGRQDLRTYILQAERQYIKPKFWKSVAEPWRRNFRNIIEDCVLVNSSIIKASQGLRNPDALAKYVQDLPITYQKCARRLEVKLLEAGKGVESAKTSEVVQDTAAMTSEATKDAVDLT